MFSKQLLTLFLSVSSTFACSELRRREGKAPFGYIGQIGPVNWALLAPENFACANGTRQSPINLHSGIRTTEDLDIRFPPELRNAKILNTGNTIEVEIPEETEIINRFEGKNYKLAQFHHHIPTEHLIDGKIGLMEVHFVHTNVQNENDIAVLAMIFDAAHSGLEAVQTIVDNARRVREKKSEAPLDLLRMDSFVKACNKARRAYTYAGSLTTPPCSETVTFYVLEKTEPVNVDQWRAMRDIIGFNARYPQNDIKADNQNADRENLLALARAQA